MTVINQLKLNHAFEWCSRIGQKSNKVHKSIRIKRNKNPRIPFLITWLCFWSMSKDPSRNSIPVANLKTREVKNKIRYFEKCLAFSQRKRFGFAESSIRNLGGYHIISNLEKSWSRKFWFRALSLMDFRRKGGRL